MELCETCHVDGWENPREFRDFIAYCRAKRDRSDLKDAGLPDGTDIDWAMQQSGHAIYFEQKSVRGAASMRLDVGQHLLLPILSRVGFAFALAVDVAAGDKMHLDTRMWIAEWSDLPRPQWGGVDVPLDAFVPTSGEGLVRGVQQWQAAAVSCGCGQGRLEPAPTCFRPHSLDGNGRDWTEFDWRCAFFEPSVH